MSDIHRPIGLVVDTTAILAFAAGSMHVHELVIIASEDDQDVGVPLLCLVEAARRDPDADLHELLTHPDVVFVAPERDDDLLLEWTLYYGREDCAAAAVPCVPQPALRLAHRRARHLCHRW